MPHRLSTHGYEELGRVEHVRPRLASEPGVRVSGVSVDEERTLWFRAEGGVAAGVYRERQGEPASLVLPDDGGVLLEPRASRGVVVAKRCPPTGAPSFAREIVLAKPGERTLVVPGQSVALSGDGRVALVVDVPSRTFTRVDVSTLESAALSSESLSGALEGADPQQAPLLSLDDEGEEALFMDTDRPRGEASLHGLALASGELTRVYGPAPAPSWVSGAFVPGGRGVLVVTCAYGDAPSTRVLWLGAGGEAREVFHAPVSAPASVPAFLDEHTAVMPLSLKTHPSTTYGPVHLVALSLEGTAPVIVTKSGDVRGSARVLPDGLVIVEGGDALLSVTKR